MSRASFVFDAGRCTGCDACRLACTVENRLDPASSWRQVLTFNGRRHPAAPVFHLSLACNHCASPACLAACPAGAYSSDAATGAVLLDSGRCIGCRYCSWACPYDAPRFELARGVMTKCTFCAERLREGAAPACAALCPTGALGFTRLEERELTRGLTVFPETGLGPSLRIVPIGEGRMMPDGLGAPDDTVPPLASQVPRRVTLRHEWTLAAFTFLAALLVAWAGAGAAGAPRPSWAVFAAGALGAMGVSAAHLGRRDRAWRALLNLRRSWLSREIAAFLLFAGVTTAWLATAPASQAPGWLAAALGFLTLVCADRVYGLALQPPHARPHSAEVAFIGVSLAALFAGNGVIALGVGLARLALYIRRKQGRRRAGEEARPAVSLARGIVGFALPLAAWLLGAQVIAIAGAIAGDLIDRCEFYAELEFESPQRRLELGLACRSPDQHRLSHGGIFA